MATSSCITCTPIYLSGITFLSSLSATLASWLFTKYARTLLPQALCTCYSFCLECSSQILTWLPPHLLQISAQISPSPSGLPWPFYLRWNLCPHTLNSFSLHYFFLSTWYLTSCIFCLFIYSLSLPIKFYTPQRQGFFFSVLFSNVFPVLRTVPST